MAYRYSVKSVNYGSPAGSAFAADLYSPQASGRLPAYVLIHGGGWDSGSRSMLTATARLIAEAGHVALNIEYPLVKGSVGIWDQQPRAVSTAFAWLRKQANVDPTRIGAWGESAGGHLALWAGIRGDAKVVVTCAGGVDLVGDQRATIYKMLGNTYAVEAQRAASPYYAIDSGFPPTAIAQGLKDTTVPPQQSIMLRGKLVSLGVPCLYKTHPSFHVWGLLSLVDRTRIWNDMITFMKKYL